MNLRAVEISFARVVMILIDINGLSLISLIFFIQVVREFLPHNKKMDPNSVFSEVDR